MTSTAIFFPRLVLYLEVTAHVGYEADVVEAADLATAAMVLIRNR